MVRTAIVVRTVEYSEPDLGARQICILAHSWLLCLAHMLWYSTHTHLLQACDWALDWTHTHTHTHTHTCCKHVAGHYSEHTHTHTHTHIYIYIQHNLSGYYQHISSQNHMSQSELLSLVIQIGNSTGTSLLLFLSTCSS